MGSQGSAAGGTPPLPAPPPPLLSPTLASPPCSTCSGGPLLLQPTGPRSAPTRSVPSECSMDAAEALRLQAAVGYGLEDTQMIIESMAMVRP